jgi:hypothetical protein
MRYYTRDYPWRYCSLCGRELEPRSWKDLHNRTNGKPLEGRACPWWRKQDIVHGASDHDALYIDERGVVREQDEG